MHGLSPKASCLLAFFLLLDVATTSAILKREPSTSLLDHEASSPALQQAALKERSLEFVDLVDGNFNLEKRQGNYSTTGALLCSPTQICVDGSCCGNDGTCGYGPSFCSAANCTSQCDATAMCGIYSEGGAVKCGMNLCCSSGGWCGTTESYCIGPDSFSVCQAGFGLCEIIPPPVCDPGLNSSDGRTIGYYQASNVRDRACNAITPSEIVTKGFTHLNFAFASIDPASYQMVPADPADVAMYTEFTALQTSSLRTWIAVGGFDFSSAAATHTTWSNLTANAAYRAAFIQSAITFMDNYGFSGIDIDWEYPGDFDRGGGPGDTENFVQLIIEMRAAFGTRFGISVTLAPDYWYLRAFDAISMEPYVDWFGFMAYDLHGSWDSDVLTLGALVRGQADVREIANDTLPLWYDGLNPTKINLGVAYYGRGYTLSDPTCNTLLCPFQGPSLPGPCTNSAGVMSLVEIETLIAEKNLVPMLLELSAMKQITWDDQWIGYDDVNTIAMKKQFANSQCFGGTMAWSVDFNSGNGSSSTPAVSTDGRCGSLYQGTVCPGSGFGDCCSVGNWCGDTTAHCGTDCLSGDCTLNQDTTTGQCGVGHWNATCTQDFGDCCSSYGNCGNGTAYCGSSQSYFDASYSILPGLTGGSTTGGETWLAINCSHGTLISDLNPSYERWADADAEDAWKDALSYFDSYRETNPGIEGGGFQFSQIISDHVHGTSNRLCLNIPDTNCDVTVKCDQQGDGATGVSTPAGYMIMNSMANIHILIDDMDTALKGALEDLTGESSAIAAAFTDFSEADSLKVTLDILAGVFALLAAPFWNSWSKSLGSVVDNPQSAGTIKDSTAGIVAFGVNVAKDESLPTDPVLEAGGTFSVIATNLVMALQAINAKTNALIFDGQDTTTINQLLTDGSSGAVMGTSPLDMSATIYTALVAMMIPVGWATSDSGAPFLMTTEGISDNGDTSCVPDSYYDTLSVFFSDDDITASYICIEHTAYWLVMGKPQSCERGGVSCNVPSILATVPGISKLDGNYFGGLTKEDLVTSTLNAYAANGNSNGFSGFDPTQESTIYDLANIGVQTAGVFTIPICSLDEASGHLSGTLGKDRWTNYPCNE